MDNDPVLSDVQKMWHGNLKGYLIGLILSLILTGASFALAAIGLARGSGLVFTLIALGIIQAIAQILFFLHVGQEAKPHLETLIFSFMVLVLLVIVSGTLWIMFDLNNRVMAGMGV
jgi:cytochrome o ubiquinol oxidase operon protein cyoD